LRHGADHVIGSAAIPPPDEGVAAVPNHHINLRLIHQHHTSADIGTKPKILAATDIAKRNAPPERFGKRQRAAGAWRLREAKEPLPRKKQPIAAASRRHLIGLRRSPQRRQHR
jgi:hypothetical protein